MKNQLDNSTARILIVDDEQSIRDGSERILKRMGCQVLKAKRGEEGLEILKEEIVSIVLLDMKMPGMDGLEVLEIIREKYPLILVIVITGFATVDTAIKAMKKGAYDFIPKPFEPDQLRIVVNRARENLRLAMEAKKLAEEKQRTLTDLHNEQSRTRTIIKALPNGVIVTNSEGLVVLTNPAFRRHVGLEMDKSPGEHIGAYVKDKGFCDLVMEISKGNYLNTDDIPTYEFTVNGKKHLMARGRPVLNEEKECLGAVVNIVDVTAMKVLDRLKSEFVAKVSHELRSPLATIHEQLALVIGDMMKDESPEDQRLLARAKEKTRGLISLIGDLLDLSRIESGSSFQEPVSVKVDDLLTNVVDFLGTRANSKNQSLTLEICKETLPPIVVDPVALESIFGNLISNAINYTPENGKIIVTIDTAENDLIVAVKDNGFGIEAKYLDKIFEKFYRVKNSKTRFVTGTGLGLPIVKGLVDDLNGTIKVESTPDTGTTFTVLFPVTENPEEG